MIRIAKTSVLLLLVAGGCKSAPKSGSQKVEMQEDVRAMAQRTLDRLYVAQPKARQAVAGAAGYAVFSNFGLKIFVTGGGTGQGVAINNRTKAETFMRMASFRQDLAWA
jgi:lipid-binding SYLF domain-containing protein